MIELADWTKQLMSKRDIEMVEIETLVKDTLEFLAKQAVAYENSEYLYEALMYQLADDMLEQGWELDQLERIMKEIISNKLEDEASETVRQGNEEPIDEHIVKYSRAYD